MAHVGEKLALGTVGGFGTLGKMLGPVALGNQALVGLFGFKSGGAFGAFGGVACLILLQDLPNQHITLAKVQSQQ